MVDKEGRPLPGRHVEWAIDGAGAVAAVDEGGRVFFRGEKTNDHAAVTYTEHFEHSVSPGGGVPEFTVGHGQSWCVVTSAEEGETHVTVHAPDVGDRNGNRVVVTQHWADADWAPPQPCSGTRGRSNSSAPASSAVPTGSRSPATQVRYRVLDGPPALFQPSQTGDAVVAANGTGVAPVVVSQPAPLLGRTRIGVELLGKGGVVVGRGQTYADWRGPDVSLSAAFPPSATVGQEAPLTLVVANAGAAEARLLTVRAAVPDGCKYVRSDPPAFQQGNDLIWTLGTVAGRDRHAPGHIPGGAHRR